MCVSTHPRRLKSALTQTDILRYLVYTIGAFLLNCFAVRLLPLIDKGALMWSLAGFGVISITLLATASPNYEVSAQTLTKGQLLTA